jgi:hypothetical protein
MALWQALGLSFLVIPLTLMMLDTAGALRARFVDPTEIRALWSDDFEVMVPIYGSMRYLENIEYLAGYGDKVLICTTTAESAQFYAELDSVTAAHGFRQFRGEVDASNSAGKRNTGGTVRDRLVRDGLAHVRAGNVVCIDADTVTDRPLNELVGCMLGCGYDMASVRLVPSNVDSWITRVQAHEYRVAMTLRKVAPWLVSGACHAARTSVHREVMSHHSLFFQGNDVETGLIAHALGYRVGHIPFAVPTTVPATPRAWLRQRLAWSGGEFRLFIVNIHLLRRHPMLWTYGSVVVILAAPFRWMTVLAPRWPMLAVVLLYLLYGVFVNWRTRDAWLVLIPLYTAFSSLILTPLGVATYVRMAISSRNMGRISLKTATPIQLPPPPAPVARPALEAAIESARQCERAGDWLGAAARWCDALWRAEAAPRPGVEQHLAMFESAERACANAGRSPQSLAIARRAVQTLGDATDPDVLVRLHGRVAAYLLATDGGIDRVFASLRIAIEVGERHAPRDGYVQALLTAVGALHQLGHEQARNETLARALGAAHATGGTRSLAGAALPWVAYLRLQSGDVDGCIGMLLYAWSLDTGSDDPRTTIVLATLLVDVLRRVGRFTELEAIAGHGFATMTRSGLERSWPGYCLRQVVAAALLDLGRVEDAATVLESMPHSA